MLPAAFVERLRKVLPEDCLPGCLESFAARKPVTFRVVSLRASQAEVLEQLAALGVAPQAIDWLPGAFWVADFQRDLITYSSLVGEGKIYIQGLSSMLAAPLLDPLPGQEVLDLAAAPGGKTIQLAELMQNQGRIAAVEVVRKRLYKLEANLRRYGVRIAETYLADGRSVGKKTPERFDRVLLDAPCSSEARFRTYDPDTWRTWSERKVRECARKQVGLLISAIRAAKVGGRILYCTCSFEPEENELVVDRVLKRMLRVVAVRPIQLPIPNTQPGLTQWEGRNLAPQLAHAVRVLPNELMDGFFFCLLEKVRSVDRSY